MAKEKIEQTTEVNDTLFSKVQWVDGIPIRMLNTKAAILFPGYEQRPEPTFFAWEMIRAVAAIHGIVGEVYAAERMRPADVDPFADRHFCWLDAEGNKHSTSGDQHTYVVLVQRQAGVKAVSFQLMEVADHAMLHSGKPPRVLNGGLLEWLLDAPTPTLAGVTTLQLLVVRP